MRKGFCTRVGRGPVIAVESGAGLPLAFMGEPAFDVVNEFFDLFFDVHGERRNMRVQWRS